ncbi:MAG: hypothetical protein JW945_05340 [Methanomicrobia archaeon]|nr:hypothetical protein [Methanomicrobia archaeon]
MPRLMIGTSPFIGGGQFGQMAYEYRQQFFCNERNMTRLFLKSASRGVAAVQLIAYEPLINALKAAQAKLEADFFVAATIPSGRAFGRYVELLKPLQPEIIAIHALSCDALDPRITGWIKEIQAAGAVPGAATHLPGETIPELDAAGFAFEVYLAPLNTVGYAMTPDSASTLQALDRTEKRVIAIKPLAAGRVKPTRDVFKFLYRHADSVSVGIVSEAEMAETYAAAEAAAGETVRSER